MFGRAALVLNPIMCGVCGPYCTSPCGSNEAERIRPRSGYMGGRAIPRGIVMRYWRAVPCNVAREAFLCESKLGVHGSFCVILLRREANGGDDLQYFMVL